MNDGRWLVAGTLVGLAAARAAQGSAAVKKKLTPAEIAAQAKAKVQAKKTKGQVKSQSQAYPFPVSGIPVRYIGPISWIAYEREEDLKAAAKSKVDANGRNASYGQNDYYVLYEPGTPLPTKLPADAFAAYGPEVQPAVWEIVEFPGWYLIDLDASGGVAGGPPLLVNPAAKGKTPAGGAPPRVANNGQRFVLYHVAKNEITLWFDNMDTMMMFVLFREAALPGYGKIEKPTPAQDGQSRVVEAAIGIPDATQSESWTTDQFEVLDKQINKLTAAVVPIWQQEGEVFPPQKWKISGYTSPRNTVSFSYAMPGDPWAANWEWPASAEAQAKGAIRRKPRRSRVPGSRRAEVTLEGVLDKSTGFQWKIRGAFEYFGRDEAGQIVLDSTGGFSDESWGRTGDDDKGLMLFQTGAGWKAAIGFGWTFMRLLGLLGGDRMDASASQTRAAIRKILFEKGRSEWRAWYELAFGARKSETGMVAEQYEIRSRAARQERASGWTTRPEQGKRQIEKFSVTIPAYENELEELANEIAKELGLSDAEILEQQAVAQQGPSLDAQGRVRERVEKERKAHAASRLKHLPFDVEARVRELVKVSKRAVRKPVVRAEIKDRVVALGAHGVVQAIAVRYGSDPSWYLLDEDQEPTKNLGTERPSPAVLRQAIGR